MGILLSVDATVLFPAVYVCRAPRLLDGCLVEKQSIKRYSLPVIFFALFVTVTKWMSFWLFSLKGKKSVVPAYLGLVACLSFSGAQWPWRRQPRFGEIEENASRNLLDERRHSALAKLTCAACSHFTRTSTRSRLTSYEAALSTNVQSRVRPVLLPIPTLAFAPATQWLIANTVCLAAWL